MWNTTFRTMTLTARRLRPSKGRIAMLQTDEQVIIPPNGVQTFNCYPDSNLSYKGTVVIEQVVNSKLPEGIEVIPTFTFHESSVESFPVTLANNTNHSFTLQSRALCAQMEVANVMLSNVSQSDIIDIPELSFDFTDLVRKLTR